MSLAISNISNDSKAIPKEKPDDGGFPPIIRHIYVGYYVIVFLLATFGNLLALIICYKSYKVTSTFILIYIASLAFADLLFTLLTPADLAAFLASSWISGAFICRFQSFLIETSYTASILTLAMISRERLVAVMSPILARSRQTKHRKCIPIVIWVIAIVSCSPLLYAYTIVIDKDSVLQCVNIGWGDEGRQAYYSVQGVLLFLFPLIYMVYSHYKIFHFLKLHSITRNRILSKVQNENLHQHKITKMLAAVTCIFMACYIPFALVRTFKYFYIFDQDMLWRFVQLMVFTQAAVNPIVYCFYSRQFRIIFKDMVMCRWYKIHQREMENTFGTRSSSSNAYGAYETRSMRLEVAPKAKDKISPVHDQRDPGVETQPISKSPQKYLQSTTSTFV